MVPETWENSLFTIGVCHSPLCLLSMLTLLKIHRPTSRLCVRLCQPLHIFTHLLSPLKIWIKRNLGRRELRNWRVRDLLLYTTFSTDETWPALTTPGDHSQDSAKQPSVLHPLSNNSSSHTLTISEDKRTTDFVSVLQEQILPNSRTPTYHVQDTSSASSAFPHPTEANAPTNHGPSQAFTITIAAFPLGDDVLESIKDYVLAFLQRPFAQIQDTNQHSDEPVYS